jgi:hypothetical protein
MNLYCLSGTALYSIKPLYQKNPMRKTTTLTYFIAEETEAQRREIICLKITQLVKGCS